MKFAGLFLSLILTACSGGGGSSTSSAAETPTPITSVPASSTFIYRVGPASDKIYYASVNPSTGALSEHGSKDLATADEPSVVAISADKKFLFVALGGSKKIATFDLNQVTGEPTPQSTYSTITPSKKLVVDPMGRFLFSLEDEWVVVYTIGADGTLFWRGVTTISSGTAITIDSLGKFLYVSETAGIRSYDIDQTTGVLSNPGYLFNSTAYALKVNPTTTILYGSDDGSSNILRYILDPATGAMSLFASWTMDRNHSYYDLEFNLAGTYLFAVNPNEGTIEVHRINSFGTLTRLNLRSMPVGCTPVSLKLSSDGNYIFTGCTNSSGKTFVYKIDTDSKLIAVNSSIIPGLRVDSITSVTF